MGKTAMIVPQSVYDLWMEAHARQAMDGDVYVGGSDSDPHAVKATIYFVLSAMGISADFANQPTRQEIIAWMNENNMADEVEYLMEE